MGAVETFAELTKTLTVIPKLAKLNSEVRQQIRDAAGETADELIRGLQLVGQRVRGAAAIVKTTPPGTPRDTELANYLDESEGKLFEAFREFKICRSLRSTRAQFKELFGLPKFATHIGTRDSIESLPPRP